MTRAVSFNIRIILIAGLLTSAASGQVSIPWTGQDQTADLQAGINEAIRSKQALILQGGDYLFSDTLRIPAVIGFSMHGVAPGEDRAPNSTYRGAATRLVWRGPDDGRPGILCSCTQGRFGITLSGKLKRNDPVPQHWVAWRWEHVKGIGTGKSHFDWFAATDCAVGMQFGTRLTEHNNDNVSFTTLFLDGCGAGLQLNNQMAMGIHAQTIHAVSAKRIVEVNAGGAVYADSVKAIGPTTLLYIGSPGPGSNNGIFRFANVKVDQHAGSGFMLLDMAEASPIDVTFEGGLIAYDDYTADGALLVNALGGARVVLRDWKNLQGGTMKLKGVRKKDPSDGMHKWVPPHLTVETSRIGGGVDGSLGKLIHAESVHFTFRGRDCTGGGNTPLEDLGSSAVGEANESLTK